MFTEKNTSGVIYMKSDVVKSSHAFTTRFGGVSEGIHKSLNLGENRGDEPERVSENYRRLGNALGIDGGKIVVSRQIHTDNVRIVDAGDAHKLFAPVPYEADALVTNQRGLSLMIFIADCVPVLLEDTKNDVIAAVHCGWRSSVMDILGKTVNKMLELGAAPEKINAAIGPSIGCCCFETGPEVPAAIDGWLGAAGGRFYMPEKDVSGKFMVDLRGANKQRLLDLGVQAHNIDVSEECTVCKHDKYWSHRATKGQRGSQAALIML